jgi:hypothetical protein
MLHAHPDIAFGSREWFCGLLRDVTGGCLMRFARSQRRLLFGNNSRQLWTPHCRLPPCRWSVRPVSGAAWWGFTPLQKETAP